MSPPPEDFPRRRSSNNYQTFSQGAHESGPSTMTGQNAQHGYSSSVSSSASSLSGSPGGSPQPLLPTKDFPFPIVPAKPTVPRIWTRVQHRLKRHWVWCLAALAFLAALSAMIFGFIGPGRGIDPTLEDPDEPLLVNLPGYGTFRGVQVVKSAQAKIAFQDSVEAWLAVEYSTQPANDTRFTPPDWPKEFTGIKDASKYGKTCIQDSWFSPSQHAEECLTFNLYRPAGVTAESKLPVFVFLHGGAFVLGSGRSFDGAAFVSKSNQPLIVVTAQYRLGALGSLPSKLFADEGLLNLGLRDQRMLLEFMQKYVVQFGGDPDRITLGGQSAGAHSVGLHLFHNYGNDTGKSLFSQAILASGAPTARSFPPATQPLYVRYYQQFMDMLKCPTSGTNAEIMACLRAKPLRSIQQASGKVYRDSQYNITWPWQPVSGGPLLEILGSISGRNNTFFKIPTLITSTTDEGKLFAPKDLSTNAQFIDFIKNFQPGLNQDDLADLKVLYPDPSDGKGPYANSPVSKQYERISAAYGDYSYICPVQETAYRLAKANATVYKARWNTPNNSGANMGVPHAADSPYFNGLSNVQFPPIADLYSSYYASFIVSGDPNRYAIESAVSWKPYTGVGSEELVVGNEERGGVKMEQEEEGIRMEQCSWWRDEERMVRMFK
ncbi:unnamed protein product [Periconia digitata]|uniref:Carboxylic ester hydrolase n=1 Tax=Periconia digitata TaxID=1303443 RepID=A0A9W4ULL1_9PLEO|nr:unnamed protein product [Periconia digitata]